ncbi:MAG: sigma factor [Bauldia sp.]
MPSPTCGIDLATLDAEAGSAARSLVRQLGVPSHRVEDFHQDLLADLIRRAPAFNPLRGTFGAFAGTIARHGAARIRMAARRERALFGGVPVSIDEPLPDASGLTRGDLVREDDGLAALLGQPTDRFAEVDRRLDMVAGVRVLTESERRLCAALREASVDELAERGVGARTTLYRRIKDIRLALMAVGVEGP